MTNYSADPTSRMMIRHLTSNLRTLVGLDNVPYFPILHFLEIVLPEILPDFYYEIVAKNELHEKHGETFPDSQKICLREDVYLGALRRNGRDRLTVAHEIGHLFLHKSSNISLCRLEPHKRIRAYNDPEWQAQAFAGELLMPAHLIADMTINEVQQKCGVSKQAAQYQLNIIKRAKKTENNLYLIPYL